MEKAQPPRRNWLLSTILVEEHGGAYVEKDVRNKKKYAISMGSQMWRLKPWRDIVQRMRYNPTFVPGSPSAQSLQQQAAQQ